MKRVVLESPYAGKSRLPWPLSIIGKWFSRRRNIRYLRACLRDSLMRGEAPIASHAIYTQPGVLDDDIPWQRDHGINAGLVWGDLASTRVICTDEGISSGMDLGAKRAKKINQEIEYRTIPGWKRKKPKLPKLTTVEGARLNAGEPQD